MQTNSILAKAHKTQTRSILQKHMRFMSMSKFVCICLFQVMLFFCWPQKFSKKSKNGYRFADVWLFCQVKFFWAFLGILAKMRFLPPSKIFPNGTIGGQNWETLILFSLYMKCKHCSYLQSHSIKCKCH